MVISTARLLVRWQVSILSTGQLAGHWSSRAREFHPHPLTEPCVKVSPHTALHTLCFVHMLLSSYPHAAMP